MENSDEIPSENLIIAATNEILKDCDVTLMTLKSIKLKLEEKFDCPLPDCKAIIRQCLENFMDNNQDDFLYAAKVKNEDEDAPTTSTHDTAKKRNSGFTKPLELSPDLAEFMGESHLARTDVTKRIWVYIKEHNLQNPSDKREILCDAALQKLFKRAKINMFKMTKALSPMMMSEKDIKDCQIASESEEESDDDSDEDSDGEEGSRGYKKKEKKAAIKKEMKKRKLAQETTSSSSSSSSSSRRSAGTDLKPKTKKAKIEKKEKASSSTPKKQKTTTTGAGAAGGNNFNKEHSVNPALAALINVGEHSSRPNVVKNIWVYIKANNLQNPADKREILMNKEMKAIFKVDKCTMFSINSLLSKQLYPIE